MLFFGRVITAGYHIGRWLYESIRSYDLVWFGMRWYNFVCSRIFWYRFSLLISRIIVAGIDWYSHGSSVCELSSLVPRVEKSDSLRCPISARAIIYAQRKSVCIRLHTLVSFGIARAFLSEVCFTLIVRCVFWYCTLVIEGSANSQHS